MNEQTQHFYTFGEHKIEKKERLLTRNGEVVPLPPKAVELLFVLLENNNRVLTKVELMNLVWADSFVEEANLSRNVFLLRKVLGEGKNGDEKFIETIPKRGYRFAANVTETNGDETIEITAHERTRSHIVIEEEYEVEETVPRGGYRFLPKVELINSRIQITPANTPNNLLTQTTTLIGREKEIAEIKNLLSSDDIRLLTLTGVGGTGKTTLAKAIAREMLTKFEDGVVFVELAGITNPELVASTIAQTLGVQETGNKSILEVVKYYLREKQILLVVDNFEQVLPAARMLAELTRAAPRSKILVTSRIRLQISTDYEFVVPQLAVPENVAQISCVEIAKYEAVRLFVERARAIKPGFILTEKNVSSVAEICRRLEGLPLAIELAAARIRIISPQSILERLENRLKLLTGGASDLPARQKTVYRTIEWSYDLLGEDEKPLFCCLAVFAGGFTIKAAEAVCGSELSKIEVLDVITSLVDNSLLVQTDQFDDSRFRMLEVVREYALESLESDSEKAEAMRRSHADYFLALGEEAEPHLQGEQAAKWLNRLEDEHDNLRDTLRWSLDNDAETAARLAAAIRSFWIFHGHLTEGREWLKAAFERGSLALPAAVRFKLLNGLGIAARFQGDNEAARKAYEEGLAEGRAANDLRQIAISSRGVGGVAIYQNDFKTGRKFIEEALAISRHLDDKFAISISLNYLGDLAHVEGDNTAARPLFEESLTISRQLGNKQGVNANLIHLGVVAYHEGDFGAARSYFAKVLEAAQELGHKIFMAYSLDGFAALAAEGEDAELGAKLAGAAEQTHEQIGFKIELSDRRFRDAYIAKLKTKMDETAFARFYGLGRKLKLDEAIRLALFTA